MISSWITLIPFADLCLLRSQLFKSLAKDLQSFYLQLILTHLLLELRVVFPESDIGIS